MKMEKFFIIEFCKKIQITIEIFGFGFISKRDFTLFRANHNGGKLIQLYC